MFLTFSLFLLVVKSLVSGALDATLAHLRIVVDMRVGKTAALHKKYPYAQQHHCQTDNTQCQQ